MHKTVFIIFFVFIFTADVFSQKVGLVLSGGGAKGIAHIGVIRSLEENGIPIDYIVGTSIGAIVGGLYAAGYTPDEMESIVLSEDFVRWSKGLVEEKYVYYFKMKDDNASMVNIRFSEDPNKFLQLPNNFVPTHQIDLALIKLYSSAIARANYNFDSLFVPFRCVASDIQVGRSAILKDGDLAQAVRASMTYPIYFDGIKINDHMMFDGGIYNNFPLDVMEDTYKPDIVIGVAVASNYKLPMENNIFLQIERMVMQHVDYNVPDSLGIFIQPDVSNFSLLDFDKANELLFAGYVAADTKMDEIKKRITRRVTAKELAEKRKKFNSSKPPLQFKNIYIEGLNKYQDFYVTRSLMHKNKNISFENFKTDFFKLYADERIEAITPKVLYNEKEHFYDLYLELKKNPKLSASIGGNISSNSNNQLYASVQYNLLTKQEYSFFTNLFAGRYYSSVKIDTRIDFPSRIPVYFSPSLTYNRWDYYRGSSQLFFEDVRPTYVILNEFNIRADAGVPLTINGKIYGGGAIANMTDQYYQTGVFTKKDTADETDFNLYTFHLTLERNTLNYIQYADDGNFFSLSCRYIEGKEFEIPGSTSINKVTFNDYHRWIQLKLVNDVYIQVNRFYVLGYYLETVFSTETFFHNYLSSIMTAPVFQPTPNSKTMFLEDFHAYTYLGLGIKNIFRFGSKFNLRLEGFLFQPYQKIIDDGSVNQNPVFGEAGKFHHYLADAAFVYHTPIGPASLSVNYYNKDGQKFYVIFNFGYTLFNKRGID